MDSTYSRPAVGGVPCRYPSHRAPPGHRFAGMLEDMTTTKNDGRVAVITGASSGIGEATARALAGDGYRLALLARRADRVNALAGELGNGSIAIPADVTDRDALLAAAARVQDELGGADVLVNNAGVMLLAPFGPEQSKDYRQMIEVNLLGAITATEVFLEQLKAKNTGDVVNISSVAGRTARPTNGVYAATKFGLGGWSGLPAPRGPARRARHARRTGSGAHRARRAPHPRRDQARCRATV